MDYFTSGQMARLNGISEKALHLYQKKGILAPAKINEETGYRYYTIDQSSTLDTILQLQTIGFSLDEIKTVLDSRDIAALESDVGQHLERIREQQRQLLISQKIAEDMLITCETLLHKPLCNQIFLENLPERHALVFDIPEHAPNDEWPMMKRWEYTLRLIKQHIMEEGYPLSLFRKVGCMASKENLGTKPITVDKAFVLVDETFGAAFEQSIPLPSGQHLVLFYEYDNPEDSEAEMRQLERMIDYAHAKGFEVCGSYHGEIIAETPAFQYDGRTTFYKLCLPVGRA